MLSRLRGGLACAEPWSQVRSRDPEAPIWATTSHLALPALDASPVPRRRSASAPRRASGCRFSDPRPPAGRAVPALAVNHVYEY